MSSVHEKENETTLEVTLELSVEDRTPSVTSTDKVNEDYP